MNKHLKFWLYALCIIAVLASFAYYDRRPPKDTVTVSDSLEGFGVIRSTSGTWEITMSADGDGLVVSRDISTGFSSSVSPSEWKNSKGCFVMVDQEDRVWAFDGLDRVFIDELHEGGSRSYSLPGWSGVVPEEIAKRLAKTKK